MVSGFVLSWFQEISCASGTPWVVVLPFCVGLNTVHVKRTDGTFSSKFQVTVASLGYLAFDFKHLENVGVKEIWHSRNVSFPHKLRFQLFLQGLKPTDILVAWAEVWAAPWAVIHPLPGNSIWGVKRFRGRSWWICNDLLLFSFEKSFFLVALGYDSVLVLHFCHSSSYCSVLLSSERKTQWVVAAQCCVSKDPQGKVRETCSETFLHCFVFHNFKTSWGSSESSVLMVLFSA